MKTPDEIKKGMECCKPIWAYNHWKTCDSKCPYIKIIGKECKVQLFKDALAYIQQLEAAQPKWISVEERLPEESVEVLTYFDGVIAKSEIVSMDMLSGDPMWSFTGACGDPTHWMPLPSAPADDA